MPADGGAATEKLESAKKWQILVSFLWLSLGWAFVVSLFSQQFTFGDNVVTFFLHITTGSFSWLPCASSPFPRPPRRLVLTRIPRAP